MDPYHANTYTITGGPQFNYRHFKYVTLFIHPDIGAMYQSVQVQPTESDHGFDREGPAGPSMRTSQWTAFYGVGGGFDLNVSKHVGIRLQSDWVYTQLFDDLLRNPQYTVAHVGVADVPLRKERTEVGRVLGARV